MKYLNFMYYSASANLCKKDLCYKYTSFKQTKKKVYFQYFDVLFRNISKMTLTFQYIWSSCTQSCDGNILKSVMKYSTSVLGLCV